MTQEEKELLLKDLCARLPYGVKYQDRIDKGVHTLTLGIIHHYERFIPYLRPMSSMTEEEKDEISELIEAAIEIDSDGDITYFSDNDFVPCSDYQIYIDYLNSHHFDYRGLIEKGVALEAPEDMYK